MIDKLELPQYQCHKKVRAMKISEIRGDFTRPILYFDDDTYAPLHVTIDYCLRHKPEADGYYVVYEDGYQSFSPAKAFEDGYTKI